MNARESQVLRSAIESIDSMLDEIEYVANFTSVYHYGGDRWLKMNVEGTLVMYRRKSMPFIVIRVLNRKSLDDFVFEFSEDTKLGMGESLMTLSNGDGGGIYGLWFKTSECPKEIMSHLKKEQLIVEQKPLNRHDIEE
ncbi:dcp1-like [Ordospora pajunii]|uniref:dcp1-like n=1 Tax=Ordospora pajunii TaxID=3039483 RepID=UPI0029526569|nr:dcp1-like [Ordospora pajunii]KAH9410623.1 dcp1-like [Ordospora pajunii]